MTWIESNLRLENELMLQKARELLESPGIENQRELILEILRIMLDSQLKKYNEMKPPPVKETIADKKITPPEKAIPYAYYIFPHEIAGIISQTYIELGDTAMLADDEALEKIRDKLLAFNAEIIDQNRWRANERQQDGKCKIVSNNNG